MEKRSEPQLLMLYIFSESLIDQRSIGIFTNLYNGIVGARRAAPCFSIRQGRGTPRPNAVFYDNRLLKS
jgi:hypothetical protein